MTTSTTAGRATAPDVTTAVANLVRFLETGTVETGLFAPDVFSDVTLPLWRLQAADVDGLIAIRTGGHPCQGQVRVERIEPTAHGFTIEFEERWEDQGRHWYSREIIRADLVGATIVELAAYCTGDWDEEQQSRHARDVRLLRP